MSPVSPHKRTPQRPAARHQLWDRALHWRSTPDAPANPTIRPVCAHGPRWTCSQHVPSYEPYAQPNVPRDGTSNVLGRQRWRWSLPHTSTHTHSYIITSTLELKMVLRFVSFGVSLIHARIHALFFLFVLRCFMLLLFCCLFGQIWVNCLRIKQQLCFVVVVLLGPVRAYVTHVNK